MTKKKSSKVDPRKTPDRDDWYMGLAFWIASKSKDPSTQNGAIIVSDNAIIGTGYNGPPPDYDDQDMDWGRPAKYDHIIHAEINAMDHCMLPLLLPGSTMYVTGMPCKICAIRIARRRIKKVVYFPLHLHQHDSGSMMGQDEDVVADIVRRTKGKLEMVEYKGDLNWMRDRILFFEELGIF